MRETGKSKTCVWRWQERFAVEGVDGLLRYSYATSVNDAGEVVGHSPCSRSLVSADAPPRGLQLETAYSAIGAQFK